MSTRAKEMSTRAEDIAKRNKLPSPNYCILRKYISWWVDEYKNKNKIFNKIFLDRDTEAQDRSAWWSLSDSLWVGSGRYHIDYSQVILPLDCYRHQLVNLTKKQCCHQPEWEAMVANQVEKPHYYQPLDHYHQPQLVELTVDYHSTRNLQNHCQLLQYSIIHSSINWRNICTLVSVK